MNDSLFVFGERRCGVLPSIGVVAIGLSVLFGVWPDAKAQSGPDPIFEKQAPITMAELATRKIDKVAAVVVSDYAYPGYTKGEFHADLNPRKAVIVSWEGSPHQFVFAHEASYCPLMMVPSGVGLCNQFFKGNKGWGDLFNANGRKERNSSVDIVQSGPRRAWVRWNYCAINAQDDSRPSLRGVEDYIAYPNGLVWRRLTYNSLMPDKPEGYSWGPIDFFSSFPPGVDWSTLVLDDKAHGDYHVAAVLDAGTKRRYDLFWRAGKQPEVDGKPAAQSRRIGDSELLREIAKSSLGFAMVFPAKGGLMPFIVIGHASGFDHKRSQVVDHSREYGDTGGWEWGNLEVDHWPVGWINSQSHVREPGSPYPYCIRPLSHYIVTPPLPSKEYYWPLADSMELNRWTEKRVFYALQGVGKDFESIRAVAKAWLEKGAQCATPESVEGLNP